MHRLTGTNSNSSSVYSAEVLTGIYRRPYSITYSNTQGMGSPCPHSLGGVQ